MSDAVIALAQARFPPDMVQVMIDSGIGECSAHEVTRDDIDHVFKKYNFIQRKNVFDFFKSLRSLEGSSAPPAPAPSPDVLSDSQSDISIANISTDTETDESIMSSSPSGITTVRNFMVPPRNPIPEERQLEEYPGNIGKRFPVSPAHKCFLLELSRADMLRNMAIVQDFVRDVIKTLEIHLERKPSTDDILVTAKRLCQEYPVLQCGTGACYESLFQRLKKRSQNAKYSERLRFKKLKKVTPTVSQEPQLSNKQAEDMVKAIHQMNGDAQRCLEVYPHLADFNQTLTLFAILRGKTKEELICDAVHAYEKLLKEFVIGECPDKQEEMVLLLRAIFGGKEANVFQFGVAHYAPRADIAQPFLFISEGEKPLVSVMVDEIPFISFAFNDTRKCAVIVSLTLLATFYLLNVEYPRKVAKQYCKLEALLDGHD